MSQNRNLSAQMSADPRVMESGRSLLAAVARSYYIDELSRIEIAKLFGISRFKVARLLSRAREEGIVSIEINDWGLPDAVLGARLSDSLGLTGCRVIRSHGDDETVRQQIGAIAAAHVSETLSEGEVLGASWGRTLSATTSQLTHLPRISIVQITGVVAGDIQSSPVEVVQQVARRSAGDVYPIFAPLFVQDAATASALRSHPDIQDAMNLFPKLTTAILSVGAWDPPVSQVKAVLPIDLLARALAGGCVADIAGILLTNEGTPVDPTLEERSINISYEQLRAVPRVIAIAGGAAKADAIRAVARAGLITELVTDHTLAGAILRDGHA